MESRLTWKDMLLSLYKYHLTSMTFKRWDILSFDDITESWTVLLLKTIFFSTFLSPSKLVSSKREHFLVSPLALSFSWFSYLSTTPRFYFILLSLGMENSSSGQIQVIASKIFLDVKAVFWGLLRLVKSNYIFLRTKKKSLD